MTMFAVLLTLLQLLLVFARGQAAFISPGQVADN